MKFIKKIISNDIHTNPLKLGKSRIPVDTCDENIDLFLKQEIIASKRCSCEYCNFKRIMLRRLQEIVKEYVQLKKKG